MAIQTSKPDVIPARDEEVIPAAEEKVFDKVWVRRCNIQAPLNGEADVAVVLAKYRLVDEGTEDERKEAGPKNYKLKVNDLYGAAEFEDVQMSELQTVLAAATTEQKLGIATTALLAAIEALGKDKEVI